MYFLCSLAWDNICESRTLQTWHLPICCYTWRWVSRLDNLCYWHMNFIIRLIWTSENRDIIFNKLCTNIHVSLYLYGEEDVYLSQLFRLNGNKTLELQYHSGTFPYGHFSKYGQFFASGKKTIHCTLYLLYLKKCL